MTKNNQRIIKGLYTFHFVTTYNNPLDTDQNDLNEFVYDIVCNTK